MEASPKSSSSSSAFQRIRPCVFAQVYLVISKMMRGFEPTSSYSLYRVFKIYFLQSSRLKAQKRTFIKETVP